MMNGIEVSYLQSLHSSNFGIRIKMLFFLLQRIINNLFGVGTIQIDNGGCNDTLLFYTILSTRNESARRCSGGAYPMDDNGKKKMLGCQIRWQTGRMVESNDPFFCTFHSRNT